MPAPREPTSKNAQKPWSRRARTWAHNLDRTSEPIWQDERKPLLYNKSTASDLADGEDEDDLRPAKKKRRLNNSQNVLREHYRRVHSASPIMVHRSTTTVDRHTQFPPFADMDEEFTGYPHCTVGRNDVPPISEPRDTKFSNHAMDCISECGLGMPISIHVSTLGSNQCTVTRVNTPNIEQPHVHWEDAQPLHDSSSDSSEWGRAAFDLRHIGRRDVGHWNSINVNANRGRRRMWAAGIEEWDVRLGVWAAVVLLMVACVVLAVVIWRWYVR